jgi:peptidoglycan-associated lipoprotein
MQTQFLRETVSQSLGQSLRQSLNPNLKRAALMATCGILMFTAGCAKKAAAPVPQQTATPPAPAAFPTVTLNASNTFVHPGDSVTLNWTSTNATDLDLSPGIGKVAPEGSQPVTPSESTTYTIKASGPVGSTSASVRVTVSAAAPAQPAPAQQQSMEEMFRANVFDAFFDFNGADIRPDARDALSKTAEFLRTHPEVHVNIEGHCDERGSTEYNLGLGDRRAAGAKNFLVSLGVTADRMGTVSYGKERPFCTEHSEECWQQNRRAHIVMAH